MLCRNCGNSHAIRWRKDGKGESCDKCGGIGGIWLPDVHFNAPYFDPNLGNPKRPGEINGVFIESKRHKAAIMREQNLFEKGDRQHGARIEDRDLQRRFKEQGHAPL